MTYIWIGAFMDVTGVFSKSISEEVKLAAIVTRTQALRCFIGLCMLALLSPSALAAFEPVQFESSGVVVQAYIARPAGSAPAGGWPLVIGLHGCGGLFNRNGALDARFAVMTQKLLAEHYAVLMPDSFASRGQREICTQPMSSRKITQTQRRQDALSALEFATRLPDVNREKIALLGWSHGGSAVLAATHQDQPEVSAALKDKRRFAVAAAYYPGCTESVKQNYRPAADVLLLVGEKDDWTAPEPCLELGKIAGVSVHIAANAFHGFDNPNRTTTRVRKDVPNGVFAGRGVTVGGADLQTKEAAMGKLLSFFAARLKT
jgi:dienelactone hydrolase